MISTTEHVNEARSWTADTLTHATEQVAETITGVARPAAHRLQNPGHIPEDAAE
jgi:hypothetical protein